MVHLQELKHMLRLDIFILLHTCSSSWVCNKHNPQGRLKPGTLLFQAQHSYVQMHNSLQVAIRYIPERRFLNKRIDYRITMLTKFRVKGHNRDPLYASSLQWCADLLQVIIKKKSQLRWWLIPLEVLLYGRMKSMVCHEMMVCQR